MPFNDDNIFPKNPGITVLILLCVSASKFTESPLSAKFAVLNLLLNFPPKKLSKIKSWMPLVALFTPFLDRSLESLSPPNPLPFNFSPRFKAEETNPLSFNLPELI